MNFNLKKHQSKIYCLLIVILVILIISISIKGPSFEDKARKCLNLSTNDKVEACMVLINSEKAKNSTDFPASKLLLENIKVEYSYSNPVINGTINNVHDKTAYNIYLKVDFYKGEEKTPFHYEVFSPFDTSETQIQPNNKKSFSTSLNNSLIVTNHSVTQNLPLRGIVTIWESKIYKD